MKLLHMQEENPVCPHCQTALTAMAYKELEAFLGRRYVYFCPHCKKVPGDISSKGILDGVVMGG